MLKARQIFTLLIAAALLSFPAAGDAKKKDNWLAKVGEITGVGPAVLWRDPTDIASRNLFYGPGAKEHQPRGSFTFVKEDLDGTSPKFVVEDQDGVRWKVKLGAEARPETVASRLVWAAGYSANEDYFLPELRVVKMPPRLHRGRKYIAPDGSVYAARLKRYLEGEEKLGNWAWTDNPFAGTRELNGLRVIMALID